MLEDSLSSLTRSGNNTFTYQNNPSNQLSM